MWLARSGIELDETLAESVILIVSELVTNAVVHTGEPAVLSLRLPGVLAESPGTVRVEVADISNRPPQPRHADGDATHGRGLELVDGLASRWGWQPEGAGKRIWCEVDRQADCQRDRQADRQVDRQADRQVDRREVASAGQVRPACAVAFPA